MSGERQRLEKFARYTAGSHAEALRWALDRLDRLEAVAEAARNWVDDVDEIRRRERAEWELVETAWGKAWLGFGGGNNHEDDFRSALAALDGGCGVSGERP